MGNPNYFTDWPTFETVVGDVVDRFFRPDVTPEVWETDERESNEGDVRTAYVTFLSEWVVSTYVPDRCRAVFFAVYDDFVREVGARVGGYETLLNDLFQRYLGNGSREGINVNTNRVARDLYAAVARYTLTHYGTKMIPNAFKGWLGIEPYSHAIPGFIRRRVTGGVVAARLGDDKTWIRFLAREGMGVRVHLQDIGLCLNRRQDRIRVERLGVPKTN